MGQSHLITKSRMMNVQLYPLILLFACNTAQPLSIDVDQVPYTVIRQMGGGIEEREYPPVSWVCTNGTDENQRLMFWPLFNYIQGSNADSMKIPMTTPVPVSLSSTGIREMCFYLAGAQAYPKPTDSKVYISRQNGLAQILKDEGVAINEERFFMVGYNDPSQLFN